MSLWALQHARDEQCCSEHLEEHNAFHERENVHKSLIIYHFNAKDQSSSRIGCIHVEVEEPFKAEIEKMKIIIILSRAFGISSQCGNG